MAKPLSRAMLLAAVLAVLAGCTWMLPYEMPYWTGKCHCQEPRR